MPSSHTDINSFCKDPFTCSACVDKIEEAALQSALNMGVPDCFYCGNCGKKYKDSISMLCHLQQNPNAECIDANS